ncbi:MAG TPA: DUF418 domain-containing protein [Holophagaceae bacterium]|nr:DUF418 domain-containing protein [Holophagaceae bacterium]
MAPPHPTEPQERIEAMDVLRGFALLGVFSVNMLFFAQPMDLHFLRPLAEHPSPWLFGGLLWLAQGKFYGLFSFLFGLGFAVQMDRFEARSEDGPRRFRRRLWVLLGLGLAHGILIWPGDILAMYALIGFALPRFARARDREIRIWILALLGLLALGILGAGIRLVLKAHAAPQGAAQAAAAQIQQIQEGARTMTEAYREGPFPVLFRQRLRDLAGNYALTLVVSPHILALFLLGLLSARLGLQRDTPEGQCTLKRVAAWGLGLGLPLNLLTTLATVRGPLGPANPGGVMALGAFIPGSTLLCLGYASALTLALRGGLAPWLRVLAWPGRMALTCYLGHAVVFTLTFNAYGLRLYGRMGLGPALLMALGLWLILIPLCRAWLSRFRMGPAEWVWRSLTYGYAQPFLR